MTLSKLSSYVYLFGNDVRLLHLHTTGVHFFEYHEKLNELYDILFNFYDALASDLVIAFVCSFLIIVIHYFIYYFA